MDSKENQERPKANRLGNCAIVFAFLIPVLGVLFGILALLVGAKKEDKFLRKDGGKAIVMSILVVAVRILMLYLLVSLGVAAPFIIFSSKV